MRKVDFAAAVLIILFSSSACLAQQAMSKTSGASKSKPIMVDPSSLKYGPLPSWAVSGTPSVENTGTLEVAVLAGNPSKSGYYAVRARCGDGYKIAPHWHPTAENVTVMQGQLSVGMGSKWDSDAMKAMPTGAFASMPAGIRHYAQCNGDTVLQIDGQGPLKLEFVSAMPPARRIKKTPAKSSGQ
jgi:quercetin dioxygenase-like cupin family protein